ncbi:MAG: nucleoside transporter C-terminal domain-containing protein [Cyanobacteria bacterium J06638_20]
MGILNLISFIGIFGLCAVAWLFSEHRSPKYFPWRVALSGIILQLILGAIVFAVPGTRDALQVFSNFLNVIFEAADSGARFVFGANIVPVPGQDPQVNLGYIFAFRALPAVIFFSGLMALLYNIGFMQVLTNFFAKIFYSTMRLSGAESLSGAANIFVGIEAAIAVKPFLASMSRSELCAILACCFGTAASSVLAIYVSFLRPVFPNILGHLVSASIMAIPACFLLAKILVPETTVPVTAGGIPVEGDRPDDDDEEDAPTETIAGEPMQRMSPLDASIVGALDGVKMAVSIAAVLILILGFVFLINQLFGFLAGLPGPFGSFFQVVNLQNILGALFLPLTVLTGVSLEWNELWASSVIIGRRLFETAIPPYQALAAAGAAGELTDRAILIVSYALSGFAHLASVGIFVGGVSALIPSRRRDVSAMGWKALFAGTLATLMISCVAGVFYVPGNTSILGVPDTPPAEVAPSPAEPTDEAPADEAPAPTEEAPPAPDEEVPAPEDTPDGTVGSHPSHILRTAWVAAR